MWGRSATFDTAIHQTHQVIITAELWSAGLRAMLNPNLPVVGGSITIDRSANNRRTATLQLADDTGLFAQIGPSGDSGLEPYGNEVRVYRGIAYADGTQELLPVGVFPINETDLSESSSGRSVTLTLTDRSRLVSDNKLTGTYYIPTGTQFLTAAQALVDFSLPYQTAVDKDVESVTPITTGTTIAYHEQDNPWDAVQQLCATVGTEVYFGPDGRLKIRDIPDPASQPNVFSYADDELSILLAVERKLTRGPNAVLLTSSAPNVGPIRSLQYDNDPNSPSYYGGPYGKVTEFYADPLTTSQSQADAHALGRLRKILGLAESITLSTIPHPAHDAGDAVHATRLVDGLDADIIIDQYTLPLDATTAATLTGRTKV